MDKKWLFVLMVVSLVLIFTSYLFFSGSLNCMLSECNPGGFDNSVYLLSEADFKTQAIIKNATGYDWHLFINSDENNENKSVAALLFLGNELDVTIKEYDYVKKSRGSFKEEWDLRNITRLDPNSQNRDVVFLIENMIAIQDVYSSEKLMDSKERIARLEILKKYFSEISVNEIKIPESANLLVFEQTGLFITNSSEYMSILIVRHNGLVRKAE